MPEPVEQSVRNLVFAINASGNLKPEDVMREGSYAEIELGMRVVGSDVQPIGSVQEVVADEQSGIFVGLSVRPNLFTHALFVPGALVERLSDGVVYVRALKSDLHAYTTPAERRHETQETYEEANA